MSASSRQGADTSSATDNQVSSPPRRVLLAEDDAREARQLRRLLEEEPGIVVETVNNGKQALKALQKNGRGHSILLTDLKMPDMDGMELIADIQKQALPVTSIVMTGFGSVESAVQAMRLGAYDFLLKPIDPAHLQLVVRRALRERALEDEVLHLREQLQERHAFHHIISKNPRMHAIFELIGNVAHTTSTVLIEGETGTGKEMIAQAIHQASAEERSGAFVAVNGAALPESLLESELFGHEKGSFTGAVGQRPGRFEMAQGGTLFLDELDALPLAIQPKLLRVLQERSFERVGGTAKVEIDVRLIAATGRNLTRLVKEGSFRKDLYYRVNVVRITLPPLRKRPEDIPLLAAHFAAKYAWRDKPPKAISPQAMEIMLNYRWPGNIRELENVIERACVIARGDTIEQSHLPPELGKQRPHKNTRRVDLDRPLPELLHDTTRALEREYIQAALVKTGGNVSRAAQICGLSRRSLTTKIGEYQIDTQSLRSSR